MTKHEQTKLATSISLFILKHGEIDTITKADIEKTIAFHSKVYSIIDELKLKTSTIRFFNNKPPKI